MPTTEEYAARLLAMTEGATEAASTVIELDEERSIENSNIPLTAAQLSTMIGPQATRSGVRIDERSALSFIAVYAAIRILAESVAMLPLVVFRGNSSGGVRERALDHPLYDLLFSSPNPEMTAAVFKETLQGHLGGWGNAYARIMFDNGGRAVAIYPLPPDRTRAERKAGQLVYTTDGGGTFFPEEVLHVPGLGFDGLKGYSPIGLAREAIGLGKAAEMFGAAFFGNGANVGGVLTVPGKMTPEQRAANTDAWNKAQSGLNNVAKTALVDGGAKYERIGIPPEDAQFLETRKFQVTEIARLYRVPPHMLAELERATFSNIEQMSLEFLIYTLTPWLEKWEQEINRKLFVPKDDLFVAFDHRRLLRADNAAKQTYYASARQWGYMNVNEIRSEEGLNPIGPQGDIYLQPANMSPAGQPQQPAAATQQSATPPKQVAAPAAQRSDATPAFVAGVMAGVVTDAVSRMARKESNALARAAGNADKISRFYAEHERHVVEALQPAAAALVAAAGRGVAFESRAAAVLSEYARRRLGPIESRDVAAEAADLVQQIQQTTEWSA